MDGSTLQRYRGSIRSGVEHIPHSHKGTSEPVAGFRSGASPIVPKPAFNFRVHRHFGAIGFSVLEGIVRLSCLMTLSGRLPTLSC